MANEFVHGTVGTSLTQAEFEAVGLHVLNSQATGDLVYASSATQLSRLGIGSTGQFLQVAGGVPTWATTLGTANGGTGVANNAASTITITGAYALTLTLSNTTSVTLPTTGTLATLAGTEELDNKTLDTSVAKGTWTASGTWTIPAVTLSGALTIGTNYIKTTNLGLSQLDANTLMVDDQAGGEKNFRCASMTLVNSTVSFSGNTEIISAGNGNGNSLLFKARDSDVGVASLASATGLTIARWDFLRGFANYVIEAVTANSQTYNPALTAKTLTAANTKSFTATGSQIALPAITPAANGGGITLTGINIAQGAISNIADSEAITVKPIIITGAAGAALETGVYTWTGIDITTPAQAANAANNLAKGIKLTCGATAGGASATQIGLDITMDAATDRAIDINAGYIDLAGGINVSDVYQRTTNQYHFLYADYNPTDPANTHTVGIRAAILPNQTDVSVTMTTIQGVYSSVGVGATNTQSLPNVSFHAIRGLGFTATGATGTIGQICSFYSDFQINAATLSEAIHYRAANYNAAGTITTMYGFYCDDLDEAGTNYPFYSAGACLFGIPANTANAFRLYAGASLFTLDSRNTVTGDHFTFTPPGSRTLPNAATARFRLVTQPNYTVTLVGTTQVTTLNYGVSLCLGAPTYNQSGGAVTVDLVSVLHIPVLTAGASVTITNKMMISTGVADCYLSNTGVWTDTVSTQKVKRNIEDFDISATVPYLIDELKPKTYQYNGHFDNDFDRQRYGLIAEEFPDFLRVPGDSNRSALNAGVLANFALVGIKYAKDEIDTLKAKVKELENLISAT